MKKRRQKRFQEMTTAELRQATKEFDREFIADKARPMNPAERARNRQLRRRRGRPRIGKGAEKINICLAKEKGIRRSTLIAQALASVVGRKAG